MASKTYTVVGPLVIAKNEDGSDRYVYQGGVVEGQSEEWLKRHLDDGLISDGDPNKVALEESKASINDAPATDSKK